MFKSRFSVSLSLVSNIHLLSTASPMVAITLQQESTAESSFILYAHKDVLTRSSAVLQTMLEDANSAKENKKQHHHHREITLEKADAKSTNIYINWLYTGSIHAGHRRDEFPTTAPIPTPTSTSTSTSKTSPEHYTGLSLLVISYLLGTRLQDAHFRDALLDAIVTLITTASKSQSKTTLNLLMQRVKHHYIQLPLGSKARKLFVHLFAHFGNWTLLEPTDSRDFLLETKEKIMRGAADDPTIAAGKCGFHEHGVGEECYRDGRGD